MATPKDVTTLKIVNLPTTVANAIKGSAYADGKTLAEYLTKVHLPASAPKGKKK